MSSVSKEIGKSVFLETFKDNPINRVLDFLIVFDKFDYSMADIAEKAGVGYSTLKLLIVELVKKGLLVQSRISGKSKMYRLNKDSQMVRKFVDFYWNITNEVAEKKQRVVVSH